MKAPTTTIGIETRSRSKSRIRQRTSYRSRTTSHTVGDSNPHDEDVIGADIPDVDDQPSLHPGRVQKNHSQHTEYRFQNLPLLPDRSPTSPVSSKDNADRYSPPPIEATSRILRSHSLPPKRRRRRHRRSNRSSIIAPITFTPTVTIQEAPHYDDSSSSSTAKPMASSVRPSIRTPFVQPPPKVDPIHRTSKQSSNIPDIPTSRHTPRTSFLMFVFFGRLFVKQCRVEETGGILKITHQFAI